MLSPPRTLPAGFIAPCLPTSAPQPPSGEERLHEIKHDGFRVIARKSGDRVKLYSRPGNDLTDRFPLIVEALAQLRSRSCIIDGEAVACGEDGIASFDRIRYRRHDADVFLYAFDLRAVGMTPALSSGLYSSQNGLLLDGEETNEVIVHEKTSVGLTEED